jgi:alpha-tubulin suppressor-like RCC1 family protein
MPQNLKNHKFVDVNAGRAISAGITADGKLYTWGKNRNGILGHQPPNLNVLLPKLVNTIDKVVQVSCGSEHICAVTESG